MLGFGHVICLSLILFYIPFCLLTVRVVGLLYFRPCEPESVCHMIVWFVSCVYFRLGGVEAVCLWVFWGWLVFSPLGQCIVWFSVCRCIWVTYFSPILVFLVLIVLFVISGVSL